MKCGILKYQILWFSQLTFRIHCCEHIDCCDLKFRVELSLLNVFLLHVNRQLLRYQKQKFIFNYYYILWFTKLTFRSEEATCTYNEGRWKAQLHFADQNVREVAWWAIWPTRWKWGNKTDILHVSNKLWRKFTTCKLL